MLTLSSSTNKSFKSEIDVNLSTSESLGAMFNILLKQIDKQINYKVMSDIAISHDLLVELCFVIWVKQFIFNFFKDDDRGGIAFSCGLKKLFQMVGPWGLLQSWWFYKQIFYNRSCFWKILSGIGDLPQEIQEGKFVDFFHI